jgi:homogentisate 1,2-dioxygenase
MPWYQARGKIPRKRHTQFRKADGSLYHEEVFGTEGFSGPYSILYHENAPPRVERVEPHETVELREWDDGLHRHRLLKTSGVAAGGDPVTGRRLLMYNDDVAMYFSRPSEPMGYLFKNADCDELHFVHQGSGRLDTLFGSLDVREGDYVHIPRGCTHQWFLDGEARFLTIESHSPVETPHRYRNDYGQHLEHSPYNERDMRTPGDVQPRNEKGVFQTRVKVNNRVMCYYYDFHPFDVVGWDGYLYPWALSIHDFEPITGRLHQPPPVHQTFAGRNYVVCSFVPRKLDYHPEAIPVPYNHSNIDSDEIIYYVAGEFGSRRGVEVGALTVHPRGIPHGPQPGAVEAGIGKEFTNELAVMLDTFRPLKMAEGARELDDSSYPFSWQEKKAEGQEFIA